MTTFILADLAMLEKGATKGWGSGGKSRVTWFRALVRTTYKSLLSVGKGSPSVPW